MGKRTKNKVRRQDVADKIELEDSSQGTSLLTWVFLLYFIYKY